MPTSRAAFAFCALGALSGAALVVAAPGFAAVEPVLVAAGLSSPLRVTAPAGDYERIFVVQQGGRVRVVKNGVLLGGSFLDLSGRVTTGGERGLLGLAFHPEYHRNGRFFVNYTDSLGNTVVSEFRVSSNPDLADAGSERVLLRQAQPFANHNGGNLAFSPLDGNLYVGLGDGGSAGDPGDRAQADGTWLGKMLRIDVDAKDPGKEYAVPRDNPFAGRTSPLPEIWAKGLRNPWRYSFDRTKGDLWIGDVGQDAWEEVDWQPASSKGAENYGWRRMEGAHCYVPATGCQTGVLALPIVEYPHSSSPLRCSVTGGVVARGPSVPEIAGRYLFADYCSGEIFSVRRLGREATDGRNHRLEWVPRGGLSIGSVTDIGEDARGDVYVTDSAGGEVFRLATTTPSSVRVVPIVLDATGREGSRFSTELVVANRGTGSATFSATYTPAPRFGGVGGGTISEFLDRGQQKSWPDALAWLRSKGLEIPDASAGPQGGSLRIVVTGLASASDGVVLARTTTPSGTGRAGLSYPAPRAQDLVTETAVLYGLRETSADRTNLAFLSGAAAGTTTLKVTLVSGGRSFVLPEPVVLDPGEWVQLDSVLSRAGFGSGWAVVERVSGPGPFWAYAVFNDNGTNDGSYVPPSLPIRPSSTEVVPVVVETPVFSSELVLANPGTAAVTARLLWVESLANGTPRRFEAAEALAAGEQKILPGFVDRLRLRGLPVGGRGGSYAGALFVSFETAEGVRAQGFAGARTASPAETGGAYGLFTPSSSLSECAFREAWLFGLRQDAAARTNLALVNAGQDGGPVTLRYEVFDAVAGRKVGTSRDLVLGPGAWLQVDRVLRDYALREGYVRVFRVAGSDRFLAYAVVNDGAAPGDAGTDDGSFVPMEAAE